MAAVNLENSDLRFILNRDEGLRTISEVPVLVWSSETKSSAIRTEIMKNINTQKIKKEKQNEHAG
ncbi:MAG: hypothetical protein NTY74_04775 [Ignavibacteriae bacterium]|nr:hypothetical protein [Ignavibacteriota bacterium]